MWQDMSGLDWGVMVLGMLLLVLLPLALVAGLVSALVDRLPDPGPETVAGELPPDPREPRMGTARAAGGPAGGGLGAERPGSSRSTTGGVAGA